MRKELRETLDNLATSVVYAREANAANHESVTKSLDELSAAITAVQPIRMDMTQELADDITRKLHGPLTISEDASDWLKRLSPRVNSLVTAPFGYGPDGGTLWLEIKPEGIFHMIIKDSYGSYVWQGTFSPPSWQKEQHGHGD